MKRTLSFVLVLALVLFTFSAMAFADDHPGQGRGLQDRIKVHGMNLKFDVPPVIKDGRTLVPVRAITNGMGAEVEWDADDKLITITRDDIKIEFTLGEMSLWVWDGESPDPEEIEMDYPASLMNNRTFVPLRFIAEALGDKVNYDKDTGDIDVIERLATPDRPWWDDEEDFLAEWNAVEHADAYKIRLFHEGDLAEVVTTTALFFDFDSMIDEDTDAAEGCYVFKVTALSTGDDYTDSRESKPSFPTIVGECDHLTLIEGQITELVEEDGLVEITFDDDGTLVTEKVYVIDGTRIFLDGDPADFEDLETGDDAVAWVYDEELIKLVVESD